jgi:hypothetical protein
VLITRVSTDSNGVQGNSGSHVPVFSPDGTQIAFQSDATNLVAGDTNGSRDIFLATLPVSNSGGIDTVQLQFSYTLPSNVENLTLLGNESLSGAGNELDNIIAGGGGGDYLSGNEGNDTISGLDGNDYIDGGVGDDVLVGNAGNDYLSGGDGNNTYIYTEGHDNINNEEYPSAINENQAFSYQLPVDAFVDMDGDVLTYSATLSDGSALPSWLSFDANTQTFSGTPSFDDAGVLSLKVMANDPAGESAEQVFSVDVVDVNRAPQAVVPVEPNQSVENQPFSYQLPVEAFIDLDGDVLTYSATLSDDSALPSWLSFDANTQTFSGTPSFDDAGVLAIKVTANDGQATAESSVYFRCFRCEPCAQVIEPVVNQSTNENQVFTYQLPE